MLFMPINRSFAQELDKSMMTMTSLQFITLAPLPLRGYNGTHRPTYTKSLKQCDQMARPFYKYLAFCNNENFPITWLKPCQSVSKYYPTLKKITKYVKIMKNLRNLANSSLTGAFEHCHPVQIKWEST